MAPLAFLAAGAWGWACSVDSRPIVIVHAKEGPVEIRVDLALTAQQQARGLMWRDSLDAGSGMLFVFADARPRVFWMKNTPVPLDIVYIGDDLRVVSIVENTTPFSTRPIPSRGPARYVLEVGAGFARRHGIEPGTRVTLPPAVEAAG